MTLDKFPQGKKFTIQAIGDEQVLAHFQEYDIAPGSIGVKLQETPAGGPVLLFVNENKIAVRKQMLTQIWIAPNE